MNVYSFLHHTNQLLTVAISLLVGTSGLFIPYSPCETDPLRPCRSHPTLPGSIVCENIQDIRTFVTVIRCNRKRNMQEVFLVQSTIDYLPVYILDFCGFNFLNLKSVSVNKLLGDDSTYYVRLEQLHLDNVTITRPWGWEPLGIMTRLLRFSVSNMIVDSLDGDLVDHLNENLQSFILASTNTTAIADNALQKFQNMIYISIQNNKVQHLKRSMFPTPSKIKYFYFGKNKITTLPENIFQDMPDLQVISLQDNRISELHEVTFRNIWNQLSYALVEGNPLKCNCKMLWLSKRIIPPVFQGACYAPKKHFGKKLIDLRLSDFHCF